MTTRIDNSGQLFNQIIARHGLKNDAALARLLGVAPPLISKIRNGALTVGAALILLVHDVAEIPVAEIKALVRGDV